MSFKSGGPSGMPATSPPDTSPRNAQVGKPAICERARHAGVFSDSLCESQRLIVYFFTMSLQKQRPRQVPSFGRAIISKCKGFLDYKSRPATLRSPIKHKMRIFFV